MVAVELGQLGLLGDVPIPDSLALFAGTTVAVGPAVVVAVVVQIVAAEQIVVAGRRTAAVLPEAPPIGQRDFVASRFAAMRFVVEYFAGRRPLDELELGELEPDKPLVPRFVRLEFDTRLPGFGQGTVGLFDSGIAVVGHRARRERPLNSVQLPHLGPNAEA